MYIHKKQRSIIKCLPAWKREYLSSISRRVQFNSKYGLVKKVQQKVHGKVPVIKIKSLNLFVSMPKDRLEGWLEQILFYENLECLQNLMFPFNTMGCRAKNKFVLKRRNAGENVTLNTAVSRACTVGKVIIQ